MTFNVVWDTYVHQEARDLLAGKCRIISCDLDVERSKIARAENAIAVIPGPGWEISGGVLDDIPSLLVIARPGIGVDNIDIKAATDRGVAVVNTPDAPTVSTAEHTLSMLLALAKGHKGFTKLLDTGESVLTKPPLVELEGKVLGIVGLGRVGRKMAHICGSCLNMKVVAFDP